MSGLGDKLKPMVNEIVKEKGALALFALFLREGAPARWDCVIAAPWADPSKRETYDYFVAKLSNYLTKQELLQIAGIVPLAMHDPELAEILKHTLVRNTDKSGWGWSRWGKPFLGEPVQEAIILAADWAELQPGRDSWHLGGART